jgi:hypothetical protein
MVQTISYNPTPGQQFTPSPSNTVIVPPASNNGTIISTAGSPPVDNSGAHSDIKTQSAALQAQIAQIQAQIDAAQKAGLSNTQEKPGTTSATPPVETPAPQSNWDKILSMFNAGKAQEAALPAIPTVEDTTNKILASWGLTSDSMKSIGDLNVQLTDVNTQLNKMETDKANALALVTRNPDMPVELQSQEQKRITQDYAIQEAGLGGKAAILNAQIATLTGDYEKANTAALNNVQLATTAQRQKVQDIEYTMDFYKDVYSAMDTADKNAAQRALDNARNAKLDAENLAQQTFDNSIKSAQLKIDQANAGKTGNEDLNNDLASISTYGSRDKALTALNNMQTALVNKYGQSGYQQLLNEVNRLYPAPNTQSKNTTPLNPTAKNVGGTINKGINWAATLGGNPQIIGGSIVESGKAIGSFFSGLFGG